MLLSASGVVVGARSLVSTDVRRRSHAIATLETAHGGSCFKILPVTGAGLGVVATRDISRGELILAETPILRLSLGELSLQAQFNALPNAGKRAVLRLCDAWRAAGMRRSLKGIARTNGLQCRSDSAEGVLCVEVSRFNHSCNPNCEQSWDSNCLQERIYACSPIQAGQALCLAYVDVRMPKPERARRLWQDYRFVCHCATCSGASSDALRARLQKLVHDLPLIGARDPVEGIKAVSEMLVLYDQEGIAPSIYRKQACYYAFQLALRAGPAVWARVWAEKAHRHSIHACGKQHPETAWLLGYARDPLSHPALWTPAFEVCDPGRHPSATDPALKVALVSSALLTMAVVAEHCTWL